jgi:polysaccharide biosynthesis transport protein
MNYEAPKLTLENKEDEAFLNPWEFLEPFIKNRWFIFLILTISMAIGVIYNLNSIPIYKSSASVVIRRYQNESPLRDRQTTMPVVMLTPSDFNTYVKMMNSLEFCEQLVHRLIEKGYFESQIKSNEYTKASEEKRNLIIRRLAARIKGGIEIDSPKNTNLVNITFQHPDRHLCQDVVNILADIVVEKSLEEKRDIAKNSLTFLQGELTESRIHVEEAEKKLYEYRKEHGMVDKSLDLESFKQRRTDQSKSLIGVQANIHELESKISQLDSLIQSKESTRFTAVISNNEVLAKLHSELVMAEIERDKLLAQFEDKHPLVIKATANVGILQNKFVEELKKVRVKLSFELKTYKVQDEFLHKEMDSDMEEAVKGSEKSIEYIVLEQKSQSEKDMYNILLSAVKEVSVHANTLQSNLIYISERSGLPERPVKPNKRFNLFMSFCIGTFLGVAFAFGREYMDITVRNPEDVKKATKLSVLSTVPLYLPKGAEESSRRTSLYVSQHPKSLFSESITSLRTHLNIKLPQERSVALAITSSAPKEGKSLIASNLACSMALDGRRTVLIDADLHRPSIHKSFGFDKRHGLFDLIVDALNPRWSDLDISQLNFGDLRYLIRLKQWSGTMKIQWDSLPLPLVISYDSGRAVGSNINLWREKFLQPSGFPHPINTKFTLDDSEIIDYHGGNGDGDKAMEFVNQYPRLRSSTYFTEQVIRQYLKETEIENLMVLTAGTNPKNPSEILSSEQMIILIQILKEKFDRIIVDCPPAWPLSDVSVLAPILDGVLWICRAGETPKNVFARNIDHIREVQPNIIGAVINAVDLRRDRYYYYGYSYYYYRYYKSNYAKDYSLDLGENQDKKKRPQPPRKQT